MEMGIASGVTATIQAFNRTSSAYLALDLNALTINLRPGSSTVLSASSAAVAVSGTFSCSGNATLGDTSGDSHTVNGALATIVSAGSINHTASSGLLLNIRPNGGQDGRILFTEDGVADRWSVGILDGDGNLYFDNANAISSSAYVLRLTSGGADVIGELTANSFIVAGSSVGGWAIGSKASVARIDYAGKFRALDADNTYAAFNAAEFQVNDTKVVGAQGAAVADATGAGDVVAQLNALLARCRAHGLIAT